MIGSTTDEKAQALAQAGMRLPQFLSPYNDGSASPGHVRVYTEAEVDEAVMAFIRAAADAGYQVCDLNFITHLGSTVTHIQDPVYLGN